MDLHGRQEFNVASRSVKKEYMQAGTGSALNTGGYLTKNQKNFAFDSNTKLSLEVAAHADNGLKYGANLAMKPGGNAKSRNFSNMDNTYLFLEGGFGRLEAGSNFSAVTMMELGAHSVATATGGVSGYWSDYANIVTPGKTTNNIVSTGAGLDATADVILIGRNSLYRDGLLSSSSESSRKVTYMSPKYSGLQLGFSYTPDQSNKGMNGAKNKVTETYSDNDLKNVFGAVLGYDHKMSGVDFAGEVHYQGGKNTKTPATNNLSEWGVGAKVAKGPFSVAASYDDAGKSNTDKTDKSVKNNYWTVGLGYEMNQLAASVTYLNGQKGNKNDAPYNSMSKTSAWSVGVDYMLASGLKTYAEFTAYSLKNAFVQNPTGTVYPANKGNVFLAGAVVKF
jgi:predicted porin